MKASTMGSVSIEEISDEFDIFGEEVNDEHLTKLQSLCRSYCIDANSVVNQWMAFSSSKKLTINSETLSMFDREWLSKKLQTSQSHTPQNRMKQKMLNKDTINSVFDADIEMLGSYATPEEKSKITQVAKRQLTPEDINSSKRRNLGGDLKSPLSNGIYSPVTMSPSGATPSAKYSSRSNAGDVVAEFGATKNASWIGNGAGCQVAHFDPNTVLTSKVKYMFQKMIEKAYVLNDIIQDMSTTMQKKHGIEEWSHIALPSQESVSVCGRVCCDSVGRLNKQSVILEGSQETSAGKCISLDLSDVQQYSLFPGQIIACDGVNITGKKFAVHKLYENVALPFLEVGSDQENVTGQLRLAVASGPYAPSDSLDYAPLSDLIKYVSRDKPDLLILMGPFVDTKNNLINSGEVDESYEEIFVNQMISLAKATKDLNCKVAVVSSSRDAHTCYSVYPQPPYSISKHNPDGSKRLNSEMELLKEIMFLSDPSTIKVNEIVIGLSSTDILLHLTKSELAVGAMGGSDRMTRLAQHIIRQHSFYPLYPPSEDVNVDFELLETYAKLPVTPHVMIIPSDLKAFVKDIDGCCFLNPGRLTTGQAGGTYARMIVDVQTLTSYSSPASGCVAQVVRV